MIGIVCAFFHTEGKGFYSKDVMKNRELRELYFQKYGVKYKVRKEKRRNS